jgi:signal transduction histidine kinase
MSRQSFRKLYLCIIGALCLASLTTLSSQVQRTAPHIVLLVIIGFTTAAANYFTTRIAIDERRGLYIGVSEAPFIFAIIATGPTGIFPILIADITVSLVWRKSRWVDVYLNAAHTSIHYLLLSAWFDLFAPLQGLSGVIAVVCVVVIFPMWDAATLSLLLTIATGRPIRSILREKISPTAWISAVPLSLGGLAGLVYSINAWLITLMLIPLVLSYFAIRAVANWLAESIKVRQLALELEALNRDLEQRVAERTATVTQLLDLRLSETLVVVHDLRHYLETIQQTTDMFHFLQPTPRDDVATSANWQTLQNGFYMARSLLGEMLDASLMEQGALTLSPSATRLEDIAHLVLQQFSARCLLAGCTVSIIAADDLPAAWCDPSRIERVLYNLIDNAIRYAIDNAEQREKPEGAQVLVRLYAEQDDVYCAISDNGPGIGADLLIQLGERGLRLAQDVQRVEGTGLGLNFCFRILALSGGKLVIASDGPGHGSTVTIRLPQAPRDVTISNTIVSFVEL